MADRRTRSLTVVEGGAEPSTPAKKAPAKKAAGARKPRTMEHAAKLSKRTMLETLRARIAAAMDDPRAHPRDVGALGKQLIEVQEKIDALRGNAGGTPTTPAEPSAIANTPNERWDEDAI